MPLEAPEPDHGLAGLYRPVRRGRRQAPHARRSRACYRVIRSATLALRPCAGSATRSCRSLSAMRSGVPLRPSGRVELRPSRCGDSSRSNAPGPAFGPDRSAGRGRSHPGSTGRGRGLSADYDLGGLARELASRPSGRARAPRPPGLAAVADARRSVYAACRGRRHVCRVRDWSGLLGPLDPSLLVAWAAPERPGTARRS